MADRLKNLSIDPDIRKASTLPAWVSFLSAEPSAGAPGAAVPSDAAGAR